MYKRVEGLYAKHIIPSLGYCENEFLHILARNYKVYKVESNEFCHIALNYFLVF